MRTKKHKKLPPLPIVMISFLLMFVCLGLILLYINHSSSTTNTDTSPTKTTDTNKNSGSQPNTINTDSPTPQQTSGGQQIKQDSLNQKNDQSNNISLTITSVDNSASQLKVRTLINKVTDQGNCELVLSKGSQQTTLSAGVQPASSYSTCKGFTVDTSKLESGTWTLKITYSDNNIRTSATKSIEL